LAVRFPALLSLSSLAYIGATYRTAHYTIRYKSIWMTVYEDWVSKEECGRIGIEWSPLSSAKKKPLTDQSPFFTLWLDLQNTTNGWHYRIHDSWSIIDLSLCWVVDWSYCN